MSIVLFCLRCVAATDPVTPTLQIPKIGDNFLHILSSTTLELVLINTEGPYDTNVNTWAWVEDKTNFIPPDLSSVQVIVDGQVNPATQIGFKRRPIYAPQAEWDLRIESSLYLRCPFDSPKFGAMAARW